MLFEPCWFYLKNYQNKKNLQNLSVTHFEPMFHGSLGISVCVLMAHIEASQFNLQIKSGGFSNSVNVNLLVLFIGYISKDVMKS